MQLYVLPAIQVLLLFIPSLILSLFFLIDLRRSKGEKRVSTLLGFFAFTVLTLGFSMMTIAVFLTTVTDLWATDFFFLVIDAPYMTVMEVLIGAGLVLMAMWTLASTRPDWLQRHKMGSASAGLILWVMLIVSAILLFYLPGLYRLIHLRLPIHLAQSFLAAFPTFTTFGNVLRVTSLTIVFSIALVCTLLKATTAFPALVLFVGLLFLAFLYLPFLSFHFGTIYFGNLMFLGICLILSWYIIDKMEETAPSPAIHN